MEQEQTRPRTREVDTPAFTESQTTAKIYAAVIKYQGEAPHAPKDSANPHFKSHFSSLPACIEAAKSHLLANGLGIIPGPCFDPGEGGSRPFVRVATRLIHTSGEWIQIELGAQPRDPGPQAIASVITMLRRYGFQAILNQGSQDDDAEAGEGRAGPAGRVPQVKLKPSPRKKAVATKVTKAEDDTRPITVKQRERLFAIYNEGERGDNSVIKAHLQDRYGISSSKEIMRMHYDEIVDWARGSNGAGRGPISPEENPTPARDERGEEVTMEELQRNF